MLTNLTMLSASSVPSCVRNHDIGLSLLRRLKCGTQVVTFRDSLDLMFELEHWVFDIAEKRVYLCHFRPIAVPHPKRWHLVVSNDVVPVLAYKHDVAAGIEADV